MSCRQWERRLGKVNLIGRLPIKCLMLSGGVVEGAVLGS